MQPFNYTQQVVNPFEQAISSATKGFQLGASIRQMQEERQAAALVQEQKEKMMTSLTLLSQNPNPTFKDYEEVAILLPKDAAEGLRKNYELRNKEQQESAKQFSAQIAASLFSPNPELRDRGIALLRKRAEAERNSGNTQEAEGLELHAKIAESSLDGAKAVRDEIMIIGSATFGKDWAEGILKTREQPKEGYRMLTAQEIKKAGLPPGSYQISPTGKIETVVKEPLVNITGPLVGAENKYAEAVGQASAEEDVGAVKAAIKGAGDLTKINRTLNELKSSQAITGFGAEAFKTIARVKTLLGSKVAAGEVADTELLDALLGSDVFPQIGALGIGARGLDTPAEREFLRMVMTGTINMNRETLIRMTEIRRDLQEESIKQYNERLERGELDRYFEITKRQKKPISLTDEQEQRIQRRRSGVSEARGGPAQGRPGVPLFTPQGAASPTSPAAAPSNIRQEADRIIRGINQ